MRWPMLCQQLCTQLLSPQRSRYLRDSWIQEPDTLEKWHLRLKNRMLVTGDMIVFEKNISVGGVLAL